MIEKLEIKTVPVPNNPLLVKDEGMDNESLFYKINELVDAVNEIMTWRFDCDDETRSENVQPDAESRSVNVQDKFAEQRKWIGCLCRFWFDNKKQADICVLGDIDEDEIHPYFNADLGHNYKHCEPVKPDDDIIYKGE